MYSALVATSSSNVSIETPVHAVSSFVHFVTQWMSTVISSLGRAVSSSHVHDTGSTRAPGGGGGPWRVKLPSSSGGCGVGPAERTGKSVVTYWPGGTREGSTAGR